MSRKPPRRIPKKPKEDFHLKKKDEAFLPWFRKNGVEGFKMIIVSIWVIGALIGFVYSNFLSPNRNSSPPEPKPTYISPEESDWLLEQDAYEEQQRIDKIREDAASDMQYEDFVEEFAQENGYYP
jgi:hypothetical protein